MPRHDTPAGDAGAPHHRRPHALRELRPLPLLAGNDLTSPGGDATSPAGDVTLYTDGACSGNPGPGGWAALVIDGGIERELTGSDPLTTNQRMELMGAIEGLAAIPGRRRVHLHTDSAYVMNCFRDRWWERWERGGWIGANKKPVANRDLWERLIAETRRHEVVWHKVAGHAGVPLNERVDRLARSASASASGPKRPEPGAAPR